MTIQIMMANMNPTTIPLKRYHGNLECGNQACTKWEEYCETVYPGQPQGEVTHQCLPLPDQCDPEEGYCSCFEVVASGAGTCEKMMASFT